MCQSRFEIGIAAMNAMNDNSAASNYLPKATTSTRLAKTIGLADLRAFLLRREITQRLAGVEISTTTVKRLAVFPGLGVVYNRIQKNANTTTMLLLDALETGGLRTIPESKGQHWLFYRAWLRGGFSLADARYLVVVRSPYSRALSSFLFKFSHWQKVAMAKYGREFDITPAGFVDFLNWLKDGALSRDLHWDLQVNSLALPVDAFTDIVHAENYESEMRSFLASTRLGPAGATTAIDFNELRKIGSPHATRAQDKRDSFFTPASRKLVSEIFAADFEAFGYSRD
jgi:hypothetical protein